LRLWGLGRWSWINEFFSLELRVESLETVESLEFRVDRYACYRANVLSCFRANEGLPSRFAATPLKGEIDINMYKLRF
jgi:hypothetical protein